MNMKSQFLSVAMFFACTGIVSSAPPVDNPVDGLLFRPEVLLRNVQQIGLSDEQVDRIHAVLEEAGPEVEALQKRSDQAMGKLAELLSAEDVEEDAALQQLDDVLGLEKDQKRLHLKVMIRIRNELTAEQRRIVTKLQRTPQAEGRPDQRLRAKLARIEKEIQSQVQAGRQPFDAVGQMQKFPELMQAGQVSDAEALLDRVISMLGLENQDDSSEPAQPMRPPAQLAEKIQQIQRLAHRMQQNGEDVSEIQELMQKIGPLLQQGKTTDAEKLIDEALRSTNNSFPSP